VSPLPLLKLFQALARLKPPPCGRNVSPEFLQPARGLLPAVPPLYLRIHGLFPAIEFAVAFSPSLPNPGDSETPLAHVCLNSDDLTATERSSAARSHSSLPGLISPVRS
jgi:hypothetical protein